MQLFSMIGMVGLARPQVVSVCTYVSETIVALSGHSWALEAISKNSPNAKLFPHVTGHVQLDCNGIAHFVMLHA